MSSPDDFASFNVEITLSTSMRGTVRKKGLIVMSLLLIFFLLVLFLYLLTILLIEFGSINDSVESGYFNSPTYDIIDWKWILNSHITFISFKVRPSLWKAQ